MSNIVTNLARGSMRAALGVLAIVSVTGAAQAQPTSGPAVSAVPGTPLLRLSAFDLAPFGYSTQEYFISGTATSYKLEGQLTSDGHWTVSSAGTAPYKTRVVVARPTDPRKFNGTVVVEWLNVTGGQDAAVDWNAAHRELLRGGYAYVAVSTQRIGVEGGASPFGGGGVALKKADPARYGTLVHPGDAFSFDIFAQAGRLLRAPGANVLLGPLVPKKLIAIGESQSANFLTTYVNAVEPLARTYDGFVIHSRFGNAAGLVGAMSAPGPQIPVRIRTDLRVPVITVVTETDVADSNLLGFHRARQPDTDRIRNWEVTGTAHADNYTFTLGAIDSGSLPLEKLAAGYKPMADVPGAKLAKPMNMAPQHHYVVEAALAALDRWIKTGQAPAKAQPIQMTSSGAPADRPTFVLDANGNALGGVRSPWVDVPTARLSGVGNSGAPLAFLVGLSDPYDAATLDRLYPGGKSEYLKKFEASLSRAIKAGFILPADRAEIMGLASIMYPGSR